MSEQEIEQDVEDLEGFEEDDGLRKARIAVVGRPNVGKSTIFNRLAGKKTGHCQ